MEDPKYREDRTSILEMEVSRRAVELVAVQTVCIDTQIPRRDAVVHRLMIAFDPLLSASRH